MRELQKKHVSKNNDESLVFSRSRKYGQYDKNHIHVCKGSSDVNILNMTLYMFELKSGGIDLESFFKKINRIGFE